MKTTFSISELASEFDITTRTIRFYEEKGYLKPKREGTRRIYSPSERTKLRLILRGRRLGLSLEESAEIVLMYGTSRGNHHQLEKLIPRIRKKRAELKLQQQDLEFMLLDLQNVEDMCLETLAQMKTRNKEPIKT